MLPLRTGMAVAMGLVGACAASFAHAQAPAADETAMSAAALELYDEARAARVDEDFPTCHAKASLAWQAEKHPKIAALLGDCALSVGRPAEAVRMLRHFLAHRPDNAPPKVIEHIESRLASATAQASAISFAITPAEAIVVVDGEVVDATAAHIVTPGEHRVTVTADGFQPSNQTVQVVGGQRLAMELVLIPDNPTELPADADGGDAADDGDGMAWWPAVALGGVGLIGVGVGAGLLAASGSAAGDADDLLAAQRAEAGHDSPCNESARQAACDEIASLRSDEQSLQNTGVALLAAGGALVAGGVLYFFLPPILGEERGDFVKLTPWTSPQVGGAALSGRF